MSITVKQLTMYASPNDFAYFEQSQPWEVVQNTPVTLSFQFQTQDQLPLRRYIVPTGRIVNIEFMRMKVSKLGQPDTAQSFSVVATPVTEDRSIWSISLTAAQASLVASGTVKFNILNGTTVEKSIQMSFFVKKIPLGSGQGC